MIYDYPVAELVGRDGYHTVVPLRLPAPPELYIPIRRAFSMSLAESEPHYNPIPRRVFRLTTAFASRSHQWWRVYNEGRSRTPEYGFVYLESEPLL